MATQCSQIESFFHIRTFSLNQTIFVFYFPTLHFASYLVFKREIILTLFPFFSLFFPFSPRSLSKSQFFFVRYLHISRPSFFFYLLYPFFVSIIRWKARNRIANFENSFPLEGGAFFPSERCKGFLQNYFEKFKNQCTIEKLFILALQPTFAFIRSFILKVSILSNHFQIFLEIEKKTLAQQSCARKAGFLYLLKQQFSFSLKHKY